MENEQITGTNTVDSESRVISINGPIDETLYDGVIVPLLEMDRASQDEIRIYLTTIGGCTDAALCLADVIERLDSPTKLYLLGTVASAGMIIVMGAYPNDNVEVCAYPSTVGMFHHGSWFMDSLEFERANDWLTFVHERHNSYIKDFIMSHSDYTEEEYASLHRTDRWYSADMMKALGFVNTIL